MNVRRSLSEKGIKAAVEIEKFKKDWDVAKSDLESLKLKMTAAKEEWDAKKDERIQKEREAKTKVDYARAMQQDALGQVATIQKEMRDLEIKLSELDRMTICAPRDGTIFRMPVFERGQMLKEGDALFTIVPDTSERVVELWVYGNDMPLIRKGDHVRLQFEGWPAVQFAGWPSVAVGTFGGEIAAIDPADDGKGKFRVQVKASGDASVAFGAVSSPRSAGQRLGDAEPSPPGLRDLAAAKWFSPGHFSGRAGWRVEGR